MNPDKDAIDELFTSLVATGGGTALTNRINGGTFNGVSAVTTSNTPLPPLPKPVVVEDILDEYSMNRFAVDHKVTAAELLKLQETAPDYAGEIKENIAKNLARDISKKVTYKKKFDKDTDVHHFIGRVWVFTDDELKAILEKK